MNVLKQSTSTSVPIGPFVSTADGVTPVTSLPATSCDQIQIIKHGATTATDIKASVTMGHIAGGMFYLTLSNTTWTNTVGRFRIHVNDASATLPVWADFMIVSANVFDSLYATSGTDYLQVDTVQVSSDTTAADNLQLDYDGTGYSKANSSTGLNTTVCQKIADTVIRRDFNSAETSGVGDTKTFQSLLGVGAKVTGDVDITGATLSVKEFNTTNNLGTQTVGTSASANPVTDLTTP